MSKPNRSTPATAVARFAAVLVATILTGASMAAQSTPEKEPLFVPRVVDVRVDNVSLERVDVSMQLAVTASRNITIRTLQFSDGFIDKIPVWINQLEGRWPLRRGGEFVIPSRITITAYARDALGSGSLAELLGRSEVEARSVVEMSFDTPWLARLFGTATDVAVTAVAFKAPVPTTNPLLQSFARLAPGVLEFMQRQAAPMLNAGPNGSAASREVLTRFTPAVATVENEYEIEGGPAPGRRTVKTLGLWWAPSIYCTTREAFEPWRYNAADASLLQVQGARLREDATRVRINGPAPIDLDAVVLQRQLPKAPTRRVYSLATGEPRKMRLAVRTDPSALVCLHLRDDAGPAVATSSSRSGSASVAAFAVERPETLIWTEASATAGEVLTLRTPVHRQSLGSPLVTGDGVVGLVASPDTAWDTRALAAAAARPLRVPPRGAPIDAFERPSSPPASRTASR